MNLLQRLGTWQYLSYRRTGTDIKLRPQAHTCQMLISAPTQRNTFGLKRTSPLKRGDRNMCFKFALRPHFGGHNQTRRLMPYYTLSHNNIERWLQPALNDVIANFRSKLTTSATAPQRSRRQTGCNLIHSDTASMILHYSAHAVSLRGAVVVAGDQSLCAVTMHQIVRCR